MPQEPVYRAHRRFIGDERGKPAPAKPSGYLTIILLCGLIAEEYSLLLYFCKILSLDELCWRKIQHFRASSVALEKHILRVPGNNGVSHIIHWRFSFSFRTMRIEGRHWT